MPQVFRIGPYSVYFWSNEGQPLEPVHVHVSEGRANPNATKIWITRCRHALIANNNSRIPEVILNRIARVVEARADEICDRWLALFGEISFFC